jgi:hypothetical protein
VLKSTAKVRASPLVPLIKVEHTGRRTLPLPRTLCPVIHLHGEGPTPNPVLVIKEIPASMPLSARVLNRSAAESCGTDEGPLL